MYARITTYRANTEKSEESQALAETLKLEILKIPGIKFWFSTGNEDGSCAVIAIYDNKASADAAQDTASKLFGRFAEYIESDLQSQEYDVLLHGTNS